MIKSEQDIFESVLDNTGFKVVEETNGFYTLDHKYSEKTEQIQTNGYNLLESLRRLCTSDLAKDALR